MADEIFELFDRRELKYAKEACAEPYELGLQKFAAVIDDLFQFRRQSGSMFPSNNLNRSINATYLNSKPL